MMAKAPAKKNGAKAAPRIIEAAGAASSSKDGSRSAAVEKAMSDAINQALADGVSDPDEQRKRMMTARDSILKG